MRKACSDFPPFAWRVPSVRQMPPQLVLRIMSMWFRYQPFACYKTKGLY